MSGFLAGLPQSTWRALAAVAQLASFKKDQVWVGVGVGVSSLRRSCAAD
jgi:hypothetical protein